MLMNILLFVFALKTNLLLGLYISVVSLFKSKPIYGMSKINNILYSAVNNCANSNASAARFNSPFLHVTDVLQLQSRIK